MKSQKAQMPFFSLCHWTSIPDTVSNKNIHFWDIFLGNKYYLVRRSELQFDKNRHIHGGHSETDQEAWNDDRPVLQTISVDFGRNSEHSDSRNVAA